ncbi:tigger transposable element-derived protein 2-like [Uranotaenia lowii]|uniref:tigger transposable element-derived protein 2-like n=1 Tax=Uranotaenia lowii TaxID=190385 RepID=UPI0024790A73|nr:tigger transposable element-derived protein 2-like [Uranotaenia lowii]
MDDKLQSDDGLITVFFLPPNVTAIIQPMDQNVIQNNKLRYREKLLLHVMTHDNVNTDGMVHEAWIELGDVVIQQSRKKIGIVIGDKFVHEDNIPLAQLMCTRNNRDDSMIAHNVEERYASKAYTDAEILNLVLDDQSATNEEAEHPEEPDQSASHITEMDESSYEGTTSHAEAVGMFDKIIDWAAESSLPIDDIMCLRILQVAMVKSLEN